ncbi:hypothetical protein EHQ53_10730 [Leptospira langatensis]|uniref:Uncharacterized protein n=1 Tax=Leptospira langatensis TaxID=2484983 RepID=A0A5F1ZTD5_9LEPT|nr:hypothetical protein [Leptospira langatensis]TGJ98965.1 hypothetical protein EHO57_15770 [Leptospira langatensis]TGL40466.1 hypothetical protein EHQ53_10730 [Leptospira langatensis]
MTALLLLLGLLSAGAGAYTLFRDPNRSQAPSVPAPGSGSSGKGGGASGGGSSAPEADRGKLVNVGEPDQGGGAQAPSKGGAPSSAPTSPQAPQTGGQEWSPPSPGEGKPDYPGLKKKEKLQLPHSTDDIIRNNSRYAHHRRPLLHSEALVDKENFLGALEILKRTNARIPDQEINGKIDDNIQAIEDHLTSPPQEETYSPDDPNYSGAPIPMGDLVRAIKDISQALGNSLSQGFQNPVQIQAPPGTEAPRLPAELPPGPVSYQIVSYAPSSGPIPPPPPGAPISYSAGVPSPPGGFPPGSGGPSPGGGPGPVGPEDFAPPEPSSKPSTPDHLDPNEMDLPEDTFFTDEWDKFKDLPLVDRRTGEDRRSGDERRGGDGARKDRRGEQDRRKEDLFKERDDYLKQKAEEKQQERERQAQEEPLPQDWPRPEYPLSDQMPGYAPAVLPEIDLVPIRLPDPEDKVLREPADTAPSTVPSGEGSAPGPIDLPKIDLPDPVDENKQEEYTPEIPPLSPQPGAPTSSPTQSVSDEPPEIEVLDGGLEPLDQDRPESGGSDKDDEPKMIHGILELKPPEVDDAPFLTLTYDFGKIPHSFKLSKNYSIMEYSYYKYKPMLIKAQEFARRKMLKNALNYYRVIKSQNIPPELRKMINRNIKDITEFMEKYLMAKG